MEGYKFVEVGFKKDICPDFVCVIFLTLVKLEIPDDAIIVYPVDKSYLETVYGNDFHKWIMIYGNDINMLINRISREEFEKANCVKSLKCRCNKAKIVEVIDYFLVNYRDYGNMLQKVTDNFRGINPEDLVFTSTFDSTFIYPFNEYVKTDVLDTNILRECSKGIHFCRTQDDARLYMQQRGYVFEKED